MSQVTHHILVGEQATIRVHQVLSAAPLQIVGQVILVLIPLNRPSLLVPTTITTTTTTTTNTTNTTTTISKTDV